MKTRTHFRRTLWKLVLSIASLCAVSLHTRAAETNEVVNAWLDQQKDLRSWSADFTQTRFLKTLVHPLVSSGHLWFAPPNRFRWELGSPAQTIALRNGDTMFLIYPQLKRAERYAFGTNTPAQWRDALALLQAGFPQDRKGFDAQFNVISLLQNAPVWELGLQPKSAFARQMMPGLNIRLATADYNLISTELVFMDGSRMRNDFTNAVKNGALDENTFEWKPPADFKITEPLSK